jgi:predicted GIY-YIG superfamily endonuclease
MSKRSTSEIFIEKALLIHGNTYDYSEVVYVNNHTKVKILCRIHGIFLQTPNNHLSGQNCPDCGLAAGSCKQTHSKEQFIKKATNIHGSIYDYSLVEYTNSKSKVKIICSNHGLFEQSAKVHTKGNGCSKCGDERVGRFLRYTTEFFLKKAEEVHGDLYDYSKLVYVDCSTKITVTCGIHGDFKQRVFAHLDGRGCRKCAFSKNGEKRIKPTEIFIEESNIRHNNFYSYLKTVYLGRGKKVIITCPRHGDFQQCPSSHSLGQGCPICGKEDTGFRRSDYIKKAKGRICTFYTIRCFNENEEFYKIGITMNTVQKRYDSSADMPYNYEIISEVYGEAGSIWDMEKENMSKLKSFKHQPNIAFAGSKSECFTQYNIDEK